MKNRVYVWLRQRFPKRVPCRCWYCSRRFEIKAVPCTEPDGSWNGKTWRNADGSTVYSKWYCPRCRG